ncbi:MAG: heme ABC exporter ATP-binding protein CcmA [Myxococcales bacterium]|nr:heme ABC exporter ATP-binding protein CcmA [Myxococcales bacterium]
MASAPLTARGIAWAAGDRFVLLDLDLDVHSGELLFISGHNGAGKTSLLAILRGASQATQGSVALNSVPLSEVATDYLAKRIAVLQHRPGLYFDLTGLENLQLFSSLIGRPLTDTEAEALLDRVGLPREAHHRRVRHYSRGMQQRTGLARIIASKADIWLLDEPSTGLDPGGRETLSTLLRQATDAGTAVLAVSHDQALIAKADRHLHLHDGRLHDMTTQQEAL